MVEGQQSASVLDLRHCFGFVNDKLETDANE